MFIKANKLVQFMTNSIEMNIQIPKKNLAPDFSIFNSRFFFSLPSLPRLFKQMCLSSLPCPKSLRYNSFEFT